MTTNSVHLIGRLVRDPEMKTTTNGNAVSNISIAVNRPRDKNTPDYFNIVVWRNNAEYICAYARKGTMIAVEGALITRSYEKDGEKRTVMEIQADDVKILCDGVKKTANTEANDVPEAPEPTDEELPF